VLGQSKKLHHPWKNTTGTRRRSDARRVQAGYKTAEVSIHQEYRKALRALKAEGSKGRAKGNKDKTAPKKVTQKPDKSGDCHLPEGPEKGEKNELKKAA
jgi:hypothetical protein